MRDAPILLVEDNPDDVTLTLRAFAKNGIGNEIIVVPDGDSCLACLLPEDGTNALHPAIILMDIHLPKINGLELLRRIREDERTRCLPVIMLTTSREERDVIESYRLGANSFVRKSVAYREFLETIRVLGAYWLRVNEPLPTTETKPRARAPREPRHPGGGLAPG
ncbi:response regulator [Streptosporangium sp. NPDC000396]|uniref:response regulator n=1 Tax=Streptosporangium sp. NPDC000396 TaxID=3366185 RepID=UPI0036C9271A